MKNYLLISIISFVLGAAVTYLWLKPTAGNLSEPSSDQKSSTYTFNGEGQSTVGPMRFDKPLVLLRAKNVTGANDTFSTSLRIDENKNGVIDTGEGWTGVGVSVAYKTAENFDGTVAFKAKPQADYYLEVDGGRWEIIATPAENSDQKISFSGFSGEGYQVSDGFYLNEGEHTFTVKNEERGNFIVYLVDEKGNFTNRLVNQIGDYTGEFTYKVLFPGYYRLAVSGGQWEIGKKVNN